MDKDHSTLATCGLLLEKTYYSYKHSEDSMELKQETFQKENVNLTNIP